MGGTSTEFISNQSDSCMLVYYIFFEFMTEHHPFMTVKYIPSWVPFTSFHSFTHTVHHMDKRLHEIPFNVVKSQMASIFQVTQPVECLLVCFQLKGVAPLSYVSRLLNAKGLVTGRDNKEKHIKFRWYLEYYFLCQLLGFKS